MPDRQALCGILLVLRTGIQWEYLSQELGFGSGMTCWRRLAAWNEAGVWDQLHVQLVEKLRSKDKLDRVADRRKPWATSPNFCPCSTRSRPPKPRADSTIIWSRSRCRSAW
ncbi:putative transposase IS4/IS5 family [Actinobacteria bacterium OK006]|nr:putative transposase IS4/IS5 family [Actinobacteria bacterium OK006]